MHDIDTGSTRPIRCNPRELSPKKIKIQQELVDKMLEEGQIEHSVSAWSAPTVLVTKKDGTTRFCVDYRRLNNSTKKDAFPLPRMDGQGLRRHHGYLFTHEFQDAARRDR